MFFRMLYGAGLALVAAQFLAPSPQCGPDCSGSKNGYQQAVHVNDAAINQRAEDVNVFRSNDPRPSTFTDRRLVLQTPAERRSQWQQFRGL